MEENTYYKLNKEELEKIRFASSITLTDYELENNFISTYSMMCVIEDLLIEVDRLQELQRDILNDRDDNWKRVKYEDQI